MIDLPGIMTILVIALPAVTYGTYYIYYTHIYAICHMPHPTVN